jgi:hypothetical protein
MTVHFYYHTPFSDDMNERRAFCRVARLLYERYGRTPTPYYLIANIDPWQDMALKGLTQLDALLIGPQLIAILEFKSCFAPFDGRDLNRPWFTPNGHALYSGGEQNINPYQQATKARYLWSRYLARKCQDYFPAGPVNNQNVSWPDAWQHLQSFVLIHPLMHPDAQPPTVEALQSNHKWFHLLGLEEVTELTYTAVSSRLQLTPDQAEQLIRFALYAEPWPEMDEILHIPIGTLCMAETGHPVKIRALFSQDEVTIGRSHKTDIHISAHMQQVSGFHARIEVINREVLLYDAGSLNGSYVNQEKIDNDQGVKLAPGVVVFLGGKGNNACQVWFEPVAPEESDPKPEAWLTNETRLRLTSQDAKPGQ